MNDDRQDRDEGNKTLMFDPAQTEAFKKMARLARQQSEQAPATGAAIPVAPAPVAPVAAAAPRAAAAPAQDGGNKTMMFGADELAKLRSFSASPMPSAPVRPAAPATIAIDPTKTLPLDGPAPAPMHAVTGEMDALNALRSGLDSALGSGRSATPPMGIPAVRLPNANANASQVYAPAPANQATGGNETVAYSPEQMARLRAGIPPAEAGGQTMMYNANESADLREAFDLLKRHQSMEAGRQTQARADAEAMLRGIGDEPSAPLPAAPVVQPGYPSSPVASPMGQPAQAAPLNSPLSSPLSDGLGSSRHSLPLTASPAQPRQAAVRAGTARFETGTPRKGKAGKVILVVLLLTLGAVLVAGGLHYAGVIQLPFTFLP